MIVDVLCRNRLCNELPGMEANLWADFLELQSSQALIIQESLLNSLFSQCEGLCDLSLGRAGLYLEVEIETRPFGRSGLIFRGEMAFSSS